MFNRRYYTTDRKDLDFILPYSISVSMQLAWAEDQG